MKAPPKALLAAGALALLMLPLVLGIAPEIMPGFLVDPNRPGDLAAPPEVRIATPRDGEGVGPSLVLAGEARSAAGVVTDVQIRVDGQRWTSIPEAPKGLPVVAFTHALDLPPGEHVLEARAYDGESFSLPSRATVRSAPVAPPTVVVLSPEDGDGVRAGVVTFRGTVHSASGARVIVEEGKNATEALVVPGAGGVATWSADVRLPPGARDVTVRALAETPGIPRTLHLMANASVPPTVHVHSPADGAAFGSRGDAACPNACILLAGTVERGSREPARVRVILDGEPASAEGGLATLDPLRGAWTYRLPLQGVFTGEHRISAIAEDVDGLSSVARSVRIHVRTPRTLDIVGDDAPRFTETPLRFQLAGEKLDDVQWRLDGTPLADGPAVTLFLSRPGDHVLVAEATGADGRAATARLPLHALNRPPFATLTPSAGVATGDVPFAATASDPDGDVVAYRWEFGDGNATTTTTPTATHRYAAAGLYRVNVTPFDDLGLAGAPATALVPVTQAPPVASFTWTPENPSTHEPVAFRDRSSDPDGRIDSRLWIFPDGTVSEAPSPTYRFSERGPQPVVLRVVDADGVSTDLTQVVSVRNLPTLARFDLTPPLPQTGTEVLFQDQSLKTDGRIVGWRWDFGDNTTSSAGPVAAHAYRAPGEYQVRLEVLDDLGERANATLALVVSDSPPDVRQVLVEPERPLAHAEVRFRAVALDREGELFRHEWAFGDGVRSGLAEPVHRYARSGLYQARVTVHDEAGQAFAFPFAVLVDNAPPRARLDEPVGLFAAFPTLLRVNATDEDGRLVAARFDADGDGLDDCDGDALECRFTYAAPGTYRVSVRVEDDEGAFATDERVVDVVAPPSGLAPPHVLVESPLPRALLKGEIMLSGTASGLRPVTIVEVQLRNGSWTYSPSRGLWTAAEGTASWRLLLDTRAFPDGPYDLVVRATDTAGGIGLATVPLEIGNGARESRVSLRLLDQPALVREDTLVRGSAWHPEGITAVRWRVDEGPWRLAEGPAIAFGIPLERAGLAPGERALQVVAYRGLAETQEATLRFRVPGEAPRLVVDEPPTYVSYGLLHASGRILGGGHAEWRLDQGLWKPLPGAGTWSLDELTNEVRGGNHTLQLRAVSPDGAFASEPVGYRVHIVQPAGDHERRSLDIGSADEVQPRLETPLGVPLLALAIAAALVARRFGALPPRL